MSRFISELTTDGGKVKKIRNKKKKQKFEGADVSLSPKHRPYTRADRLHKLLLEDYEDEEPQ